MKIFSLFDKVANRFISVTMCETEQLFVRNALPAILMDYAINDVEFYCVGDFDEDLGLVKPCVPRLCSWECYKFPEKRDSLEKKYLTIQQINDIAKAKKQEFLQKEKDNIKDVENAAKQCKAQLEIEESKKQKDKKRIKALRDYLNELNDTIHKLKEVSHE